MTAQFPRSGRLDRLRRLSAGTAPAESDPDEKAVTDWLTALHRLEGVPFHCLVPDIGMLPAESVRFFQVDPNWIEALLDGAFSVGGQPGTGPVPRPNGPLPQAPADTAPQALSGFLLRSAAVSGWPGLEARVYADAAGTRPLDRVRLDRVAPNVLFGLYAGVLARVDLSEPTEALHFGADPAGVGSWTRPLRYADSADGHAIGELIAGAAVPVPLRPSTAGRVVLRAADLAEAMRPRVWAEPQPDPARFDAGLFALEMVEGVQAVSFRTG